MCARGAYISRAATVRVEGRASVGAFITHHHISKHHRSSVMEAAIQTLVAQFKTYAGKDESSGTLSKHEFSNLLLTQLPNYAKGSDVDALMSSQDENNDGELTFFEFWKLIGWLASEKEGGLS